MLNTCLLEKKTNIKKSSREKVSSKVIYKLSISCFLRCLSIPTGPSHPNPHTPVLVGEQHLFTYRQDVTERLTRFLRGLTALKGMNREKLADNL